MTTDERFIMSALADELEMQLNGDSSGDEMRTINIARNLVKDTSIDISIEQRLQSLQAGVSLVILRPCMDGFELEMDYMNGDNVMFFDKKIEGALFKAEQDFSFGNHFVKL